MTDNEAIKWAASALKNHTAITDGGCTFSPDFNFTDCCKRHDAMRNWHGKIPDSQADRILRKCIVKHGHPVIAWVYWTAVRVESFFGSPLLMAGLFSFATVITLLYFF